MQESVLLCMGCSHLRPGNCCRAYPDGIPEEISAGHWDHRKPCPGDHGIQYRYFGDDYPKEREPDPTWAEDAERWEREKTDGTAERHRKNLGGPPKDD